MEESCCQAHSDQCRGLPPAIHPGCRILIVGSFPSLISLRNKEYYANPRNDFWKIMESVLNIPVHMDYQDRIRVLLEKNVGLWDVFGSCFRKGSSDATIRDYVRNPVEDLLIQYPHIRCIACNGRLAERGLSESVRTYCRERQKPDIIYLPSSSPAHAIRFEEKCRRWSSLKLYLI